MNRKVKSLMVLKGITSVSIARKMGVTTTWMSLVVTGRKKSKRIQQAIADALGTKYEKLWSDDKQKNGKSKDYAKTA